MGIAVLRRGALALATMGAVALVPAMTSSAATVQGAAPAKVSGVERLSGADRYEASANISKASYAPGVAVAFVASGAIFTDALSGAPVAARDGGPMLLVRSTEIPSAITAELSRLAPRKIVVLGGPNSISDAVENQLKSYTSGSVERWMGADRYDASAQISQSSFSPGVNTAFVSSGQVFADALSGAPVAGIASSPMLLTSDDHLPQSIQDELDRLNPKRVVVLGGPNSVSDAVLAQLTTFTGSWVPRWFGADRYEASAQISAESFAPGVSVAYVAYGQVFADALSGAPVAGKNKGPMLLVGTDSIPSSIRSELLRLRPHKIVVLGGPASISTSLEAELGNYVVS